MWTRLMICTGVALWAATPALADHGNNLRPIRAFEMLDTDNDGALSLEEYRRGAKDDERDNVEANFRHVDANKDGLVSARELREAWTTANNVIRKEVYEQGEISSARLHEAAFLGLDADGDDFVSLEEFRAGTREKAERVADKFRTADANNDGRLSRAELTGGWEKLHGTLRQDVYVGAEADSASVAAPKSVEDVAFESLDNNRDGLLSYKEYRAGILQAWQDRAEQSFKRVDSDKDGALSRTEFHGGWDRFDDLLRREIYDPAPTTSAIDRRDPQADDFEVDPLFTQLDANSDGQLTLKEFRSGVRKASRNEATKRFKQLDTDNDGRLSAQEFRADWVWIRQAR